jgi:hypothetical protein
MRVYPCDRLVPSPSCRCGRGIGIGARRAVWPWVAQTRLAPCPYDWIDNLGRILRPGYSPRLSRRHCSPSSAPPKTTNPTATIHVTTTSMVPTAP